jgi:hypothetical protein
VLLKTYMDFCQKYITYMIILHNENPIQLKGILKKFFVMQAERMKDEYSRAIESGVLKDEDPHMLSLITFGYISGLVHELAKEEKEYGIEDFMQLFDRLMLIPLKRGAHTVEGTKEDT